MIKPARNVFLYFLLCFAILSSLAAPAALTASASFPNAPAAPGHNVNFQAVGVPDGVTFAITGTRVNNGGHPTTYNLSFTTPDLSTSIGVDDASQVTYSGFPPSLMAGDQYFELVSTVPASPFTAGAPGGLTTVVATYQTCLPPSVTVDPGNQTVQYGSPVTLTVSASVSTLTYQWYKDDTLITGADQASYTIPFVTLGDEGEYYAVVTNGCGTDTSASAQLTVTKADQLITFEQPATPATYNTTFTVTPTASSGLPVTLVASGVCSNTPNEYEVTMNSGTGVCVLVASQAGDDNYFPAPDVVRTVDAARANQTIDFPAPASPAVYGTTFAVTYSASSGLPVVLGASGGCTTDGANVTMTSGTVACTLTASQGGDSNYAPAPDVPHTVAAAKADQTISFVPPDSPATYGSTFNLTASASSGLVVSFGVSGVCTVAGNQVTMTGGTGACTITASQAGNDNYNPAPDVVYVVTAAKADQTINFTPPASPAAYGTTFGLNATAASGLAVSFGVSGVCSLSGTNVTMTSGTGNCTITASQAGDDNYNPALDVQHTVIASRADQTINFPPPPSPAAYNTSFTVDASATSGLIVALAVEGVCSLDGNTVTMMSGIGTCTITASQSGDDNYNPAANVVHTVVAVWATQTIDFPAPSSPAVYMTTFSVGAIATSGLPVSFEVEGVCSLSGNEVTMTSGTGTCTITASQSGDDYYAPAPDVSHVVEAAKAEQSIDFPAPPTPAVYATSFTLQAAASSGLALSYEVEGVCSLTGNEVTMTSGTGACTVSASQSGDNNYNPASEVTQVVNAAKADQQITFVQPPSPVKYQTSFIVSPTSSSGLDVMLASSGSCTSTGYTVTITKTAGACLLTASQPGNLNYLPAESVQHSVEPAPNGNIIFLPLLLQKLD